MSHVKGSESVPLFNKTISQALSDTCAVRANEDAIHFLLEGVHFTFAKLLSETEKLAAGLRACGLETGDHVLLAGLIFSGLSPALPKDSVLKCLAMGDFRAVICFPTATAGELYRTLIDLCPELRTAAKGHLNSKALPKLSHVIMGEEDHRHAGTFTLSEIFGKGTTEQLNKLSAASSDVHGIATIQFSMGTTGEPKPVLLSHFQVLNSCLITGNVLKLHETKAVLCCPVPLFRGPVMCLAAMATVVFGVRVVYPSAIPTPSAIFRSIQECKCTCVITNPIAFHLMLRLPSLRQFNVSSLRTICFVGEHIPHDLPTSLRRLSSIASVVVGVCLTEAGCMPIIASTLTPTKLDKAIETQGQVADHHEVQLLAFDGSVAPRGQIGEICVRPVANSQFLGYYKEHEMSRSFFVHGWILTGDIGVMDSAGNIQVLGQKQDVINCSSNSAEFTPLLPWPIERKLASHPDLLGAQLVGVPTASGKTKLCAIIVLKARDGQEIDEVGVKEDLMRMCREEKLPEPDFIVKIADFPRTPSKKVQKFKLREMVLSLIKEQIGRNP